MIHGRSVAIFIASLVVIALSLGTVLIKVTYEPVSP